MIVEIFCTNKCNWNCYYCCEDIHNTLKIPEAEDIKNKVILNKNNSIILSGGEPGLIDSDLLYWIYDNHNNISVNTNGMFIKKYPDLVIRSKKIYYHCSKDLDNIEELFDYDNIEYLIIVTDDNIHKLESFLERYKNIKFDAIPCDMPKNINNYFNLKNKDEFYKIIKKHNNILNKSIFYAKTNIRYKLKKFI